jgi:hypothetical protein
VRVYLDNRSVGALEVDPQGRWRGDIEDIKTGIYTLRVDELDQGGDVISRVETPFKRESPEVLARATADNDGPDQGGDRAGRGHALGHRARTLW